MKQSFVIVRGYADACKVMCGTHLHVLHVRSACGNDHMFDMLSQGVERYNDTVSHIYAASLIMMLHFPSCSPSLQFGPLLLHFCMYLHGKTMYKA